jgi:hypothetical protein
MRSGSETKNIDFQEGLITVREQKENSKRKLKQPVTSEKVL